MKYKFLIDGTNLSCVGCESIPSGNAGVLECEFDFIDDCGLKHWYCSFRKSGKVKNVEIEAGRCSFSDDMLTGEGKLFIGVFGSNMKNSIGFKRISTNFVQIDVERGAFQEAVGKVHPTLWEQMKCELEKFYDNLRKHESSGIIAHPDGSITEEKLSDNSISEKKLKKGAVTYDKLASGVQRLMFKGTINPSSMADELRTVYDEGVYVIEDDYGVNGDSFLIVDAWESADDNGEYKLEGVSQTKLVSNGVLLSRSSKVITDNRVSEWEDWKETYISRKELDDKPGTIGKDGGALFGDECIDGEDIAIAYGGEKTKEIIALDLSQNMGGWQVGGMCIGVSDDNVELFDSLNYIYVTYKGEELKLNVNDFTKGGKAKEYWGDNCYGADLWVYYYDNIDFDFMQPGIVQENIDPIVRYIEENSFEVKKDGRIKSPTIDEISSTTDANSIICEAEGETINVNDSAELPLKKLSVLGKTKQLKSTGKNIIPFPFINRDTKENYDAGYSTTVNGITFLVNEDGSVSFWGTATADAKFRIAQDYGYTERTHLPPGTYIINAYNSKCYTNTFSISLAYKHSNKEVSLSAHDYNSAVKTFTIEDAITDAYWVAVDIVVKKGYRTNYETVYPMLEKSDVASGYEPYTHGIPSPSPEYPQPMNSAGKDGSIDIEISNGDGSKIQNVSVNTPNGLPGVPDGLPGVPVYPMNSGDPYIGFLHHEDAIDIDGQERICDEVDFAKGVYIQRVGEYTIDIDRVVDVGDLYVAICKAPEFALSPYPGGMWELGGYTNDDSSPNDAFDISDIDENEEKVEPFVALTSFDENIYSQLSPEGFKARYNGSKMLLIREEPIVTPLSEEQIQEYKGLALYKPYTTISNDEGAYLQAEYIADTKAYIDNKFAELQTAIINNI